MMGLTERQRACLEAIGALRKRMGRMPTMDEIGEEIGGASRSAVRGLLQRLEQRGYLKRIPAARRAILVRNVKCPKCGADLSGPA